MLQRAAAILDAERVVLIGCRRPSRFCAAVIPHDPRRHTHRDVISSYFACVHRTNSIKGLEAFADNANAYNRMLLNHLSISEAYHPPTFSVGELPWEEIAEQCRHERDQQQEPFGGDSGLADDDGGGDGDYGLMFSVGDSGSDAEGEQSSSGDEYERRHSGGSGVTGVSGMCFSLSPPGTSLLARRRMRSSSSSGDSFDLDKENLSPQKIPSAIF